MKKHIPYSLIFAAAASGMAFGAATAYTTPVGYVTQALAANQYNLVALTVHNPTAAAGIIDAKSASPKSVTDNDVNFTNVLIAGSTYILELSDGTVQEIVTWSGSVLTTPDDITVKVTIGTTAYKLRKANTVSEVFGATNTAGLTPSADGSLAGVDKVLILNAGNTFDTVFYFNDGAGTQGWFDDAFNPAQNKPIVYADAFFVQKAASASSLVTSGEVKTKPTGGILTPGYNYVGGESPVGLTLGATGLQAFLTPSVDGSLTSADLVLVQKPNGTYTTTFYFNDGAGTVGWFDDAFNDASTLPITTGILIQNKGAAKSATLSVPTSYNSL